MINVSRSILLLLASLFIISCSGDSEDNNGNNEEKIVEATFCYLVDSVALEPGVPRSIGVTDECLVMELAGDPEEKDPVATFVAFDFVNYTSFILSGNKNGFIIYRYDPFSYKCSEKAVVAKVDGNNCTLNQISVDWIKGTSTILSTMNLTLPSGGRTRSNPSSDDSSQLVADLFGRIASKMGALNFIFNFIPGIGGVVGSAVTSAFGSIMEGLQAYVLAHGSREQKAEAVMTMGLSAGGSLLATMKPKFKRKDMYHIADGSYKALQSKSSLIYRTLTSEDGSDEDKQRVFPYITRTTSTTQTAKVVMQEAFKDIAQYNLSVQVSDIAETSATVYGTYQLLSGSAEVKSTGFLLMGAGKSREIQSDGLKSVTLKDLEPSTLYEVYAYLITTDGIQYLSEAVVFTTKEEKILKLSTSSVTFEGKGGEATIQVTTNESASWKVASSPSWCSISVDESSFTIRVKETKEERSGEIVVESKTDGEVLKAVVKVSQKPDAPVTGDIVFTGTWNESNETKAWIDGSLDENESGKDSYSYECKAVMNSKNGEYYLSFSADGNVIDEGCLSEKPAKGKGFVPSTDEGGTCEIRKFQYSATEDEIKRSYEIYTHYNTTTSSGTGLTVIDIVITGLTTQKPVLKFHFDYSGEYEDVITVANKTHKYKTEESTSVVMAMTGKR